MDRHQLLYNVRMLRRQGKSIRTIAADLGVNRGRVARALKTLERVPIAISPGIANRSHGLGGITEGPFVGRQHELGQLQAMLADVASAQGRLAMLVGEPGIGKTRTAQELATHAGQTGAQVLWGRCYEHPGAPPYWPWVQSIRSYVQTQSADVLHADMGAGAADIAEIIPDLHTYLLGLPPHPNWTIQTTPASACSSLSQPFSNMPASATP